MHLENSEYKEAENLPTAKMPKVNATPRIREAIIGIGILCGFLIFHSGTSSENIQGKHAPVARIGGTTSMLMTDVGDIMLVTKFHNNFYLEIRYDNLDLHISLEQERN